MTDRRNVNMHDVIKETIVPIIVAIIIGMSSSFLTIKIALGTLETKVIYVERDVELNKKMIEAMAVQREELAIRGIWMDFMNEYVKEDKLFKADIRKRINSLERERERNK